MSDKYLNIDLHDPRAAAIAEVLANKTCKKILDLLAEKEMSESDLSNTIGFPLNTIGYNIKKLLESGFILKSKTYFWSVKGKKIPTYKLANKKILISPRRLHIVMPTMIILGLIVGFLVITMTMQQEQKIEDEIKYFNSYEELKKFLVEHQGSSGFGGTIKNSAPIRATAGMEKSSATDTAESSSYSQTNIQVQGVDEPDFVKNDGKYIYSTVGNKIIIVKAFPATAMKIVATIDLNRSLSQIFINGDTLVIIGNSYEYQNVPEMIVESDSKVRSIMPCIPGRCGRSTRQFVEAFIYDIKDRTNPVLKSNFSIEGNYNSARMIDGYVYLISTQYLWGEQTLLPSYRNNGIGKTISAQEIGYFDVNDESFVFTSISALSLKDGKANVKSYLTGTTGVLYMSGNNLYLTAQKHLSQKDYFGRIMKEVALPLLPEEQRAEIKLLLIDDFNRETLVSMSEVLRNYSESLKGEEKVNFDGKLKNQSEKFLQSIRKELEKTKVFKIGIDNGQIEYKGSGEVQGRILNQFSMDEFDGKFRIATTTGDSWDGMSLNHLFILNSDMKIIGSVEDLAPGERIYSVRFMGNKAYVVTFKKIDPFYVIDLSQNNPKVLGYLKVPGYSDYLHPYDENHIIGIGKNARGGGENFAWYQGIKVSLFDVTDFEHPVESAHLDIGDRGTDSQALQDHKAFLFDKQNNLLVLPILLAQIDKIIYRDKDFDSAYGVPVWQGAYVLNIDTKNISVKGKITHVQDSVGEDYSTWYDDRITIKRALTMGDVLYTISSEKIKAHELKDMNAVGNLDLPYAKELDENYLF